MLCYYAVLIIFSFVGLLHHSLAFLPSHALKNTLISNRFIKTLKSVDITPSPSISSYGSAVVRQRAFVLHDLLGLGPTEIVVILVAGLVLFGPDTLKSLSKDVGRAAAELKEIPKTFKEGMDEGAKSTEVERMKALAAEKRKKRDEKLASRKAAEEEDDDEEDAESA
jgi:Sec-independent protein translocase protein TatA